MLRKHHSSLFIAISILLALHISYSTQTIVRHPKQLQCEKYNLQECLSAGKESCESEMTDCEEDDPDKPSNCFVLWSINNVTGEPDVQMKGCFTENVSCNQTECIDNAFEKKNNLFFCCCKDNLCNVQHKWIPTSTPAPKVAHYEPDRTILYVLYVCIALIVLTTIVGTSYYIYRRRKQAMFDEIPTIEPEISVSSQCLVLRPIQLIEMKAHGRFGTVWKGQYKTEEVAVKIFPMHEKQSWVTEQEIYKLPRMTHPNILYFVGAEKHVETHTDFWLITTYQPNGSLCDYLKSHTVTWPELCKIGESMARGLQHLHEEIGAGKSDGLKPALAHRDFKSKNVLLKDDLTACIADFGLALVFTPGKPCGDTHGQVGTRRYMAPEILEGAINFTRDAFLRIDVYACGLVLWELVSRCTVHGGPVSEYALPFEAELGTHPTLEEMQENVVMKKLRPTLYKQWKTHSGLNAMCDTIEECWDHDAEARLSSSCVMERVAQHTKYPQKQLLIESNTDNLLKNSNDSM